MSGLVNFSARTALRPLFSGSATCPFASTSRYISSTSSTGSRDGSSMLSKVMETTGTGPSVGSTSFQTRLMNKQQKSVPSHTLHVKSSRNNIILTFTDDSKGGKVFPTITGGTDKDFKKAHRSSYEAAHQAALKVFKAIEENGQSRIRVAFNGIFGQGREAIAAALAGPEGIRIRNWVCKVEDRTPIRIGGTRAKKPRRL